MDFIEIIVTDIDGEAAETVSDLFNRYGYGGAVIETYPPNFDRATVRTVILQEDEERLGQIKAMLALIGRALPTALPEPQFQVVGKSDWATSWKEHFHVIRVAQNFVIKPSWRDYLPTTNDVVIEIDPGLAFGSGLHPTTQLCLKMLETLPLVQKSVFDVGTGSAILSLAALKLGAASVRAVDIDEVALEAARENFERNGYPIDTAPVTIAVGSAKSHGDREWDIVIANILAHILTDIMDELSQAVAPEGCLILSGIIADQETDMLNTLADYNLQIIERHIEGDWVAFITQPQS